MPKAKKFIDKKNSVTFHLVHRSQKDPLAADENAPQKVLVPVGQSQASKHEKKSKKCDPKQKEELQKYGIFFDDDYDYLQHLKDVNKLSTEWERVENTNQDKKASNKDKPKINLPSSVFESNVEEKVGLLNKAAPSGLRLDLDPEVIAALDDDFDFNDPENELEDNFMELANAEMDDDSELADSEYSDASEGGMFLSDEEKDEVGSLYGNQFTFKDEETRSRFTDYSMSSSIMKRNEQLTLLDDKFERMYEEYSDNEIGPLDTEEIEGYLDPDSNMLMKCVEEYEKQINEPTENIRELMQNRMKIAEYSSSDEGEEKLVVKPREDCKWDCESILSTYSNIYNHPKLIEEPKGPSKIKVDPKTGIPKNVLMGRNESKLTAQNLARFNIENTLVTASGPRSVAETMKSALSTLSIRPKDETPEERKERQKQFKAFRKERRIERKANTLAFKEEKKRQEKVLLNKAQNIQGNRLL